MFNCSCSSLLTPVLYALSQLLPATIWVIQQRLWLLSSKAGGMSPSRSPTSPTTTACLTPSKCNWRWQCKAEQCWKKVHIQKMPSWCSLTQTSPVLQTECRHSLSMLSLFLSCLYKGFPGERELLQPPQTHRAPTENWSVQLLQGRCQNHRHSGRPDLRPVREASQLCYREVGYNVLCALRL